MPRLTTQLFAAALLLAAPAAFAKGDRGTVTPPRYEQAGPNGNGFSGKGSNSDSGSTGIGSNPDKGATGTGSNPDDDDDDDNDDGYKGKGSREVEEVRLYAGDSSYLILDPSDENYTNTRPAKKIVLESGLRLSTGKSSLADTEVTGGGFYGRMYEEQGRFAMELAGDTMRSDLDSAVTIKHGDLLLGGLVFFNPDGVLRPYGSLGFGATWHSQNNDDTRIYGALTAGAGLNVDLGKTLSLNVDARVIADDNGDSADAAALPVDNGDPQNLVLSSFGISYRW